MNKRLLIRHIKGEVTPLEREEVISWINKSGENEAYYTGLMNLVILENISKEDPAGGKITAEMKDDSFRRIKERIAADSGRGTVPVIKPAERAGRRWRGIAAAAVVLLAVSAAFNIYQFGTRENITPVTSIPAVDGVINTYYTENGVKGKVMLPDSSVVWLNSGSRITYPEHFASDKRRVTFEGEGYFDIERAPQWPMEVVTVKGMRVEVLGTIFHIKSYKNDDDEQATLFSGKIDISKSDGTQKILTAKELKPLESLRFTQKGNALLTPVADTTKKVAWKRGELLFDQTPMPEVIKMLERWHGVEIIAQDPGVLSYRYTASFGSESIVQILELFRFTSPLDYSIEDNKVYLKKRKI